MLALAALMVASLALAARADAYIYWTGLDTTTTFTNAVGRANLDGTEVRTDFIANIDSPLYGLAADGNRVYWTHSPFVSGPIGGANFDGSGANDSLINPDGGFALVTGVATDGTHVYWSEGTAFTSSARPKIVRANPDGSGAGDFIGDLGTQRGLPVVGMAVDDRYIYWANRPRQTIGRANLGDGGDVRMDLVTGASLGDSTATIAGVAADNGYVYWANRGRASIGRANIDGTNVRHDFITGTSPALGVAVEGDYIYWANTNTDAIGRAELPDAADGDPSNVNQSFIQLPPDTGPAGLAVDPRPVSCVGSTATIVGTDGSDTLRGTNGADVISAGPGNDMVVGLGGDDVICATPGADTIEGRDGDDVVRAGTANDKVSGGAGDDDMRGNGGDDTLRGGAGDDLHKGGAGDDALHGTAGQDTLQGGSGDDVHRGGGGDDVLAGGAGDDLHHGGGGEDDCRGGGGSDSKRHC